MAGKGRIVVARARTEWRVFAYHPLEWLLISGHRLIVTVVILIVLYLVFGLTVVKGLVPFRAETPVLFVLFALISGNFTLIAIVVSLSQFVLARHLETPGEIREKIDDMIRYRQDVGETAQQSVIPISPSQFFLILFEGVGRECQVIDRQDHSIDSPLQEEFETLITGLGRHAAYVIDILERPETGLHHALYTTLSADYETAIHTAWRLQVDRDNHLPATIGSALDRLVNTLEQIEIARRSFKSVFIQNELASLSRLLLVIGLPSLLLLIVIMLMFSAGARPIVSPHFLPTAFPVVMTVGLAPIVLLASYILRLATVAHRTATLYPFSRHAE